MKEKFLKYNVLIENDLIAKISSTISEENAGIQSLTPKENSFLFQDVIDDQVHFVSRD